MADGGAPDPGTAKGGLDTGPATSPASDGGADAAADGGSAEGGSDDAGVPDAGPSNVPTGHWDWQPSSAITCDMEQGLTITVSGTGPIVSLFGYLRVGPDGKITFGSSAIPSATMTVTGSSGVLTGTAPAWTGLSVDATLVSDDGLVTLHATGAFLATCP